MNSSSNRDEHVKLRVKHLRDKYAADIDKFYLPYVELCKRMGVEPVGWFFSRIALRVILLIVVFHSHAVDVGRFIALQRRRNN